MAQRRFHYEQAFEHYLRANRVPYVAVDEARKALTQPHMHPSAVSGDALKSFDFVVYSPSGNLLLDVKGRKCALRGSPASGRTVGRLESWVTDDDVESLAAWQHLFGDAFRAVFVFLYWCEAQPPDSLFQEVFTFHDRWYVLRCVDLADFREHMVRRSERWRTWAVPTEAFRRISRPFEVHRLINDRALAAAGSI
ncbi:MAG: HYExAFE family protein [Phycisphaerales bacterium]|nr:HYExAFE family protein [Phycisphaerales bacterium]